MTYPSAEGVIMDTARSNLAESLLQHSSLTLSSYVLQHEYQVFNYDQLELTWPQHIDVSDLSASPIADNTPSSRADTPLNATQYSCQLLTNLSAYADSNLYTIIGEWTTSPTDCAMWLNGRGVGARWDGTWQSGQPVFGSCNGLTGNMTSFSEDYKTFLRQ